MTGIRLASNGNDSGSFYHAPDILRKLEWESRKPYEKDVDNGSSRI